MHRRKNTRCEEVDVPLVCAICIEHNIATEKRNSFSLLEKHKIEEGRSVGHMVYGIFIYH